MAKAASSLDLRSALKEHLEKTEGHAEGMATILGQMGQQVEGNQRKAMEGLVKEGGEVMEKDMTEALQRCRAHRRCATR